MDSPLQTQCFSTRWFICVPATRTPWTKGQWSSEFSLGEKMSPEVCFYFMYCRSVQIVTRFLSTSSDFQYVLDQFAARTQLLRSRELDNNTQYLFIKHDPELVLHHHYHICLSLLQVWQCWTNQSGKEELCRLNQPRRVSFRGTTECMLSKSIQTIRYWREKESANY